MQRFNFPQICALVGSLFFLNSYAADDKNPKCPDQFKEGNVISIIERLSEIEKKEMKGLVDIMLRDAPEPPPELLASILEEVERREKEKEARRPKLVVLTDESVEEEPED
tara:strand:- start:125 stop:454 length:330 start_codon:yes stop_codon:yes gene_type:complete